MANTFTYKMNYPAKLKRRPMVSVHKFGEGYEQRIGKGLNSDLQMWDLVSDKLDTTTATAIDTFLSNEGAVTAFNWTNPNGVSILVVCREWEVNYNDDEDNTFSATFEQVPG